MYIANSVSRSMLYVANFGASGVHIFFVISGFIMVYTSFEKNDENFDSEKFLIRRFIRIYPIFWLYAAVYILSHYIVLGGYNLSILDILRSLLLLPGYSPLIIGPAWTLSFEIYFYICFAVFMTLGLLRGLLIMTLFFLASIAMGSEFHSDNIGIHLVTDSLLMEFLLGAWIAYFFVSEIRLSAAVSNALMLIALIIFLVGLAFGYRSVPSALSWGVPSALLIAGAVFKERGGTLPNIIRKISFLGDSSYSLYLIHILMIDAFLNAYLAIVPSPKVGFFPICLALTALCVLVAIVFYKLIERRIVRSLQITAGHIMTLKTKDVR